MTGYREFKPLVTDLFRAPLLRLLSFNSGQPRPPPGLPPVRPASRVLERRELLVHRRRRRRLRLRRLVIGLPRSHACLGRGGVRAVGLVERLAL